MAELTYTLGEHPQIIELLSVLEQNNLQKQKEEVQALVGYIDGMEEAGPDDGGNERNAPGGGKAPRQGIRARCTQLVTAAEGKIQQARTMVSTAKVNLISSAGHMVQTFREKGAPPCVKRCRLCGFPPCFHGWSAASPTLAGLWNSVPESWM